MATKVYGKTIALSPARKLVTEMLYHAAQVPSIPVSRQMNVSRLLAARTSVKGAPAWTALFMRAYGMVAQTHPALRRAYMPWPTPHLYEHPFSVGALVVERDLDGEAALLAAKVSEVENCTARQIQDRIDYLKNTPVWEIGDFRQLLRIGMLPHLLRRFIFWQSLYWSGAKRAKRFGTFMVSSYGSLGAEQVHPITPLTSLLTFGPIDSSGNVCVKVIYDHRVMDGRTVAVALASLQQVLDEQIPAEIAPSAGLRAA